MNTEQKCNCKCHRESGTVPDHNEMHCPSCHTEQKGWRERFIEEGARLEHARWSRWQQYVHEKCELLPDGSLKIPKALVDRWTHQIARDYKHLSEQEKESDRKEVREYLPFIERTLQSYQDELVKKIEVLKEEYRTRKRMTPFQDTLFNHAYNVLSEAISLIKETKI